MSDETQEQPAAPEAAGVEAAEAVAPEAPTEAVPLAAPEAAPLAPPSSPLAPPAAWTAPDATPPLDDNAPGDVAVPAPAFEDDDDSGLFGGHPEVLAGTGFAAGFLLATVLRRIARD